MRKKKSFILDLPYFLATDAGSLPIRLMFCSCYALLMVSYIMPVVGTVLASIVCLSFWQFFEIRVKKDPKYKIYIRFLLQRLLLCNVLAMALLTYCVYEGVFNIETWAILSLSLALLNATDIYFSYKGFVGVLYIHGRKI